MSEEETQARDPSHTAQLPIDHRAPHGVPSSHGEAATDMALGRGDAGYLTQPDLPESDA
jgi:type IV pilus biogenesis protein CpaD/CtpE